MEDIYGKINADHLQLIKNNEDHLINMLDYAISELVEIAQDNDIYMVDDMNICYTYEDIFQCLKHRAQRRKG